MVASASPPIWALGAVALVLVGAVLSGCATTQDANQRASIQPTGPWRAARRWRYMAPTATCGS